MSDKKLSRLRRARRARAKIRELGTTRLSIHRTPRHIYAQVIAGDGAKVLASASTLDKDLRSGKTGNADAAKAVGALIAERAKAAGIASLKKNHTWPPRPERDRSRATGSPIRRQVSMNARASSLQPCLSKSMARRKQVSSSSIG